MKDGRSYILQTLGWLGSSRIRKSTSVNLSHQQLEGQGLWRCDPIEKVVTKIYDHVLSCCCGEVVTIHAGSWLNPTTTHRKKQISEKIREFHTICPSIKMVQNASNGQTHVNGG